MDAYGKQRLAVYKNIPNFERKGLRTPTFSERSRGSSTTCR